MPEKEEVKNPIAARKVKKADREKLRRDRLNEHFIELGNTIDPDRPKNDKATILSDTVQTLKDLMAEVNRLKSEYAALSEESRELTQEKNELKEEKTSLKSDIENLNVQYQQRLRSMFPWTGIDPSVLMASPYSFPVPIPMHPSLQPYPFFASQNAAAIPNPCSTFIPYPAPPNLQTPQPSAQFASASQISIRQDSRSKSLECTRGSSSEKCDVSNDVATELELKTPGSAIQQDLLSGEGRASNHIGRKEVLQMDVVQVGFLHLKDFRIAHPIVWVMLQSLINAQLTDCCYIDLQLTYRGCIHLLWLMAYANSNQFPICTNATPIYIINESLA